MRSVNKKLTDDKTKLRLANSIANLLEQIDNCEEKIPSEHFCGSCQKREKLITKLVHMMQYDKYNTCMSQVFHHNDNDYKILVNEDGFVVAFANVETDSGWIAI